MFKILFVCTGNICRSPTAEGVFRQRLDARGISHSFHVDSAGTHGYHIGEAPDLRSIQAAKKRGVTIDTLRARKVHASDFHEFDLILALDRGHLRELKAIAPKNAKAQIELLLSYAGHSESDVPDPYYGSSKDFETVLDLVEAASDMLITKLQGARQAS